MTQTGALSRSVVVALMSAALTGATRGSGAAPGDERELPNEPDSGCVQHACREINCATVLAVYHRAPWEPSAPFTGHGLSRNPPFGASNPHVPLVTQPSSTVQRRKDIWIIEVCRRDGRVQAVEQSYPALLQRGDEVLIEGDHVRTRD